MWPKLTNYWWFYFVKLHERRVQRLEQTVENTPCKTSEEFQVDLEKSGVVVSTCTILHTLNQVWLHSWRQRRTPQSFWDNVLWTDGANVELYGNAVQRFVYRWLNEAHEEKNTKQGGGSHKLWGCFAASGTGGNEWIKRLMKSLDYWGILEWNVLPNVRKQGQRWRSFSKTTTQSAHPVAQKKAEKEMMDCFILASNESCTKSHWKPIERTETCLCKLDRAWMHGIGGVAETSCRQYFCCLAWGKDKTFPTMIMFQSCICSPSWTVHHWLTGTWNNIPPQAPWTDHRADI